MAAVLAVAVPIGVPAQDGAVTQNVCPPVSQNPTVPPLSLCGAGRAAGSRPRGAGVGKATTMPARTLSTERRRGERVTPVLWKSGVSLRAVKSQNAICQVGIHAVWLARPSASSATIFTLARKALLALFNVGRLGLRQALLTPSRGPLDSK